MTMSDLRLHDLLGHQHRNAMRFSEFVDRLCESPDVHLQTSATLISNAIRYFGFEIVVRGGQPVLSYKIFRDPFSSGVNAVYGQELCIKHIVDVIESFEKESSPKRGIVLVGPPASGKTNIVDLVTQALENYTKECGISVYGFYYQFTGDHGRSVELRPSFMHNPILLFPITLQKDDGTIMRPRHELLEHLSRSSYKKVEIPTYFQYASLDKRNLDILDALLEHPRNRDKTLFEVLEEYVRVEEIEFSNPQAKGIANIDDMRHLHTASREILLGREEMDILYAHLPGKLLFEYGGAMVSSNRGMLHIHDAFGIQGDRSTPAEADYKPLLMLLGSGKISLHSTQTSVDNTVVITTNLDEMHLLEKQLSSSKLLDRIEKVPVNYLLDAVSEMDILRRDMRNMKPRYDVDPNLMRMAAYYSVMTRLQPPQREVFPPGWSEEKCKLYNAIRPEQKLFILGCQSEDPVNTIRNLPLWHPFRNECLQAGINIFEPDIFANFIVKHPDAVTLENTELFSNQQLKMIDDEFMRELQSEYYPDEGKTGLSIRQLQNIMRNTISHSDGRKVTVGIFLNQLDRIMSEGAGVHHWLAVDPVQQRKKTPISPRLLGSLPFDKGEGDYGDFRGLIKVVRALYFNVIRQEITMATVDRDPQRIEIDLRKYLQHALLARAHENKAFAHIIVPRFTFVDPDSGDTVDHANEHFMRSIEQVLYPKADPDTCRRELAQKFLDLQDAGEIRIDPDKPIVTSQDDNLLSCFSKEYTALLSHRKAVEGISPEALRDAFFHRQNDHQRYRKCNEQVRELVDAIVRNLISRFNYSKEIAIDTVVFALRNDVIDFSRIIS